MKKHKRAFWITGLVLAAIGLFFIATVLLFRFNRYTLELKNNNTIIIEFGTDYHVTGLQATCRGTLLDRAGMIVPITVLGDWNTDKLGTYPVTFTASVRGQRISESGTLIVQDSLPPEIALVSDPNLFTNPSATYTEEGYSAYDNYDGDITDRVLREEHRDKIIYSVTDTQGNSTSVERTIVYKDAIPPVITLTGGPEYKAQLGQTYTDPGFIAVDECDGDITKSVTVAGSVDGYVAGTYTQVYRVSDSSGNQTEVIRHIQVTDLQPPVITLSGERDIYIKVGSSYSEPGYSATDSLDGDLTSKVKVQGSVDSGKMGNHTITYTVTDAHGHTTTATRSVFVYEKQAVSAAENPGDKVIYLTFDDGPSKYTANLLDILDKYGVKATFFVTNQFPKYQHMIGETYRRGHAIALHTYSHQYAKLYASEAAYFQDLSKIEAIVKAQTGTTPTLVRFPGGTSNTISRKYCAGIMSVLSKRLSYHGYLYCDWNVSSGDAGGTTSAEGVANNVIKGVQRQNVSIVLQHDISAYSTNAVDKILFWGIQNGYTFLPMSEKTPLVQFSPQN